MLLCRHSFYHFHDRNRDKKGGWIDWQGVWLICAGSSNFPVAPDFCLDIIPGRYTGAGKAMGISETGLSYHRLIYSLNWIQLGIRVTYGRIVT